MKFTTEIVIVFIFSMKVAVVYVEVCTHVLYTWNEQLILT